MCGKRGRERRRVGGSNCGVISVFSCASAVQEVYKSFKELQEEFKETHKVSEKLVRRQGATAV